MTETIFRVGDIVEAFGVTGKVTEIEGEEFPVKVVFDTPHTGFSAISDSFMGDGRVNFWHKTPALKLIHRERTKKNGYIVIKRNSARDNNWIAEAGSYIYATPEEAEDGCSGDYQVVPVEWKE